MVVRIALFSVLVVTLFGSFGLDARQPANPPSSLAAAKQVAKGEVPIEWSSEEYDSTINWLQSGNGADFFVREGTTLRRYSVRTRTETLEIAECRGATAIQAVSLHEDGPEYFVVGFENGSLKLFGPRENDEEVVELASLNVFNREVLGLAKFSRPRADAVRIAVAAERESNVIVVEVTSRGLSESNISLEHSRPVTALVNAGVPITGDQTGTVRGWTEQGDERWSVEAHRRGVGMMAAGRDRVVTLGARGNTLKKLAPRTGQERGEVRLRRGVVSVSYAIRNVAVAYQNGTVELWPQSDIRSGSRNPEHRLQVGTGRPLGVHLGSSRILGVTFERDRFVHMVRLEPLAEIPRIPGRGELPQYLYPVHDPSSDLWGYIDASGDLVIEHMFTRAWFPTEHGYFRVSVPGRSGISVFNRDREWVVTPSAAEFLSSSVIGPDRLRAYNRITEESWLTDFEGNEVAPEFEFTSLRRFHDGRAVFQVDDKRGVIDLDGNVVVEPRYDLLSNFVDEHAIAHVRGESTTLINVDGEMVTDFGISRAQFYPGAIGGGRVCLFDLDENENRVYDFEGNVLITRELERYQLSYVGIIGFSEGYGRLLRGDGTYHLVDRAGEVVSGPYSALTPFIDGFAVVRTTGGAWGILNHNLTWFHQGASARIQIYPGPMFAFYGSGSNLTHYMNANGDLMGRPE